MGKNTICPQRVLKEAIEIAETLFDGNKIDEERFDNSIEELKDLMKKLPSKM